MSTETITFGGTGGGVSYFPTDLGSQFIGCNAGTVIDQIWVSSGGSPTVTYGGGGGSPAGSVQLPANGIVRLIEIWAGNDNVISYLKFGIPTSDREEQVITFGTSSATKLICCTFDQYDLWVKFYGIRSGEYVYQLTFEIVDNS